MRQQPRKKSRRRVPSPMILIVGAAIAVAAVISIIVSAGSGGDKVALPQTQPVTVTGAALPPFGGSGADSAVGLTAPALSGSYFDGSAVRIATTGKPMVVVFVAHWCPHCQKEVPLIAQWIKAGAMPSGFDFVGVSTATSKDRPNYPPSAWLEREGWPLRTLVDDANSSAANAFGLNAFPYFVALDAKGAVVKRTSGELTTDELNQLFLSAKT